MRRAAICCGLLLLLCVGVVWAGYNPEPHMALDRLIVDRMTVGRAIALGYLSEEARWEWGYVCEAGGSGIDMRHGGTKQPVGAGGIRDLRTDLWGGPGGIVVNSYTDANGYGVYYTRYDASGDSISIYRYAYAGKAGANRSIGAITCGARPSGWVQVACSNYDMIGVRGLAIPTADITGGVSCWAIDSTTTQSADSVVLVDKWYRDIAIAADDTCQLEVRRRIRLHKGEPYILVRYNVRSMDLEAARADTNDAVGGQGDSIRFVWTDAPGMGVAGVSQLLHLGVAMGAEVGYQNNFGEVRQEHLFDDAVEPVGTFLKIGNLLGPADTTSAGVLIREEVADSVWIDQGSGTTQALGIFVAFNPNGTIPTELFYGGAESGSHVEGWAVLAYDSVFIGQHEDAGAFNYDSTDAVTGARGFSFRSAVVALDTTDFSVWEYAIGTVRFSDQETPYWPAIPKIKFTDGTVLAIPYYRKR